MLRAFVTAMIVSPSTGRRVSVIFRAKPSGRHVSQPGGYSMVVGRDGVGFRLSSFRDAYVAGGGRLWFRRDALTISAARSRSSFE